MNDMAKNLRLYKLILAALLALAVLVACGQTQETPLPGATVPGISLSSS